MPDVGFTHIALPVTNIEAGLQSFGRKWPARDPRHDRACPGRSMFLNLFAGDMTDLAAAELVSAGIRPVATITVWQ